MPFFMSRKKARTLHRDLSPITRLAYGATNLAKATTQAISTSQTSLNQDIFKTMGNSNSLEVERGRESKTSKESTKSTKSSKFSKSPKSSTKSEISEKNPKKSEKNPKKSRKFSKDSTLEKTGSLSRESVKSVDSIGQNTKLMHKSSINSELTNISTDNGREQEPFQRHYPEVEKHVEYELEAEYPTDLGSSQEMQSTNFGGNHSGNQSGNNSGSQINAETMVLLNSLRNEVDNLNEENLNMKTDAQIKIDQLESYIESLTQENTNLKTQINSSPSNTLSKKELIIGLSSEKIEELANVLQSQVQILAESHNISPVNSKNKKVIKRMQQHVPNWVRHYEDLGPLVHAYNTRLEGAYKKILDPDSLHRDRIETLEGERQQYLENNDVLKQHLVDLSSRCQKLTEETRELIDPVQAELALKQEEQAHENTKHALETELAETRTDLENKNKESKKLLEIETENLNNKLKNAVKVNSKYIATQSKLMEKLDQLGAEVAVSRSKEAEWKLHVDRSVNLLEKAVSERDVYHQLAMREHENCRYAINSASSLKLQHLRDLQGMFKKNVVDGGILRNGGHFHSLGQEVGVMKASLGQRVDEMEKNKKDRFDMMKQIEEMTEKLQIPIA